MCFYEPSYQLFVSIEKNSACLVFEWSRELPLYIFHYLVGNKSLNQAVFNVLTAFENELFKE